MPSSLQSSLFAILTYGLKCWNNKHRSMPGSLRVRWGVEAGKGVSQLCVRSENEVAALADNSGPFSSYRSTSASWGPIPRFIVWRQARDLSIIFKLTASCHYLFPEDQSEIVFEKAGSQPTTSPSLWDPFPPTPSHTHAQPKSSVAAISHDKL